VRRLKTGTGNRHENRTFSYSLSETSTGTIQYQTTRQMLYKPTLVLALWSVCHVHKTTKSAVCGTARTPARGTGTLWSVPEVNQTIYTEFTAKKRFRDFCSFDLEHDQNVLGAIEKWTRNIRVLFSYSKPDHFRGGGEGEGATAKKLFRRADRTTDPHLS